jgi:hypothetical protein
MLQYNIKKLLPSNNCFSGPLFFLWANMPQYIVKPPRAISLVNIEFVPNISETSSVSDDPWRRRQQNLNIRHHLHIGTADGPRRVTWIFKVSVKEAIASTTIWHPYFLSLLLQNSTHMTAVNNSELLVLQTYLVHVKGNHEAQVKRDWKNQVAYTYFYSQDGGIYIYGKFVSFFNNYTRLFKYYISSYKNTLWHVLDQRKQDHM